MVVGLTYSQNLKGGMWELEKCVCLLVFPLLMASAQPFEKNQVYLVIKSFVVANVCFGIISLYYATYTYVTSGQNIFFYHDLVLPLFNSHATYFSIYIIFSLVAVIFFYREVKNPTFLINVLTAGLVIFFSTLIYLLSIRLIIILYSAGVVTAIIIYIVKSKNLTYGGIMLVIFVFLVVIMVKNNSFLINRISEIMENHEYKMSEETMEGYNGFTTRLAQWESSLSIIQQHPVIGVAPGDVQDELQKIYKKNYLKYCYQNEWDAHNQYIQTTLGLGVIGLLVFLAGMVVTVWFGYTNRSLMGIAFIVLFACCSITESTLNVQKGIVFYSFFQSLFVFQLFKRPDRP
jgi:O-antigen ligase